MNPSSDKCIAPSHGDANPVGAKRSLIVFDFDGVVADSEVLANTVLAAMVTELGTPMTPAESMQMFMGRRLRDVVAGVREATGRPLADDFGEELTRRTIACFRAELCALPGLREYLAAFASVPLCIASSSAPERLAACLDILGLADAFGVHVYSASHVARGKPHPDLFLHAARQCGVAPTRAIVIEDSETGIRAAVAAGMRAIGLLAASHIAPDHEARLRAAGAHAIARDYGEAEAITRRLLAWGP